MRGRCTSQRRRRRRVDISHIGIYARTHTLYTTNASHPEESESRGGPLCCCVTAWGVGNPTDGERERESVPRHRTHDDDDGGGGGVAWHTRACAMPNCIDGRHIAHTHTHGAIRRGVVRTTTDLGKMYYYIIIHREKICLLLSALERRILIAPY